MYDAVLVVVPGHQLVDAGAGRGVLRHGSQEWARHVNEPGLLVIDICQPDLHGLLKLHWKKLGKCPEYLLSMK